MVPSKADYSISAGFTDGASKPRRHSRRRVGGDVIVVGVSMKNRYKSLIFKRSFKKRRFLHWFVIIGSLLLIITITLNVKF